MNNQISKHFNSKKLTVLILDQGRQALPFLKSLRNAGHNVICVCNTRISEAYFSRYPTKKLIWPSSIKYPAMFEECLLNYLDTHQTDIVIGVSDFSAEILSKNKNKILQKTRIAVPDYSLFSKVVDKYWLMDYCIKNNIPCPRTREINEKNKNQVSRELEYTVLLKPKRGVGAIGIFKFYKPEEVVESVFKLQEKFGDLIIQEYIPQENGMQYQAEAFLDNESKMKACIVFEKPRFFPVNGGTSSANITIRHPEIESITKTLLEGLQWQGAADVDFILDPRTAVPKVLEINPRVTAGIKTAFAAGIDFADLHIKLALNKPIPRIDNYESGIYCRNFFLELLWFVFSNKKMKQNNQSTFFKFFGKKVFEQTFSIDDPLPFLGFFLNMGGKYLHPSTFLKKIGRKI